MASFTFQDMTGRNVIVNPRHVVAIEPMPTAEQFEKMVQAITNVPEGEAHQQGMNALQGIQQLLQAGATASVLTVNGLWSTNTPYTELEQQFNSMLEDIR